MAAIAARFAFIERTETVLARNLFWIAEARTLADDHASAGTLDDATPSVGVYGGRITYTHGGGLDRPLPFLATPQDWPMLDGYMVTAAKPAALVYLSSRRGEPLLAMHHVGAARVVALPGGLDRWATAWLRGISTYRSP